MSHATAELHETRMFEIIPTEDHDIVHEEMAREGWDRRGSVNGEDVHLTRGNYFKLNGTKEEIDRIESRIRTRLKRTFSIEASFGTTYGYGLKPVVARTTLLTSTPVKPLSPLPKMQTLLSLTDFYLSKKS